MIRRRTLLATPALLTPALLPVAAAAQAAPPVAQDDTVGRGLRRSVLIRWGDRVTFDAPPFDPNSVDAEAAGAQFG